MNIMKHSNKFMLYCRIENNADPEEALVVVMRDSGLSLSQLENLVEKNDISCITGKNFEQVLDALHVHAFDNFNDIVIGLNEKRGIYFPKIQNNLGLKEIIDQTCICESYKCGLESMYERNHPMCVDYLLKKIDYYTYNAARDFLRSNREYSIEIIKYVTQKLGHRVFPERDIIQRFCRPGNFELAKYYIENKLVDINKTDTFINILRTICNVELAKFCIENKHIDLGKKYNMYKTYSRGEGVKSLDCVWIFLEHDIADKEETFNTAVSENNIDAVKLLYEKGFVQNHCSKLAFMKAVYGECAEILNFMFDKKIEYPMDVVELQPNRIQQHIAEILYKRVDKKFFDGGREVDPSLPPIRLGHKYIVYEETFYSDDCDYDDSDGDMPQEFYNDLARYRHQRFHDYGPPQQPDSEIVAILVEFVNVNEESLWVNYEETSFWREEVGKHPIDSRAYAIRFGTKRSTEEENDLYLKIIIDGASPEWLNPFLVHIKCRQSNNIWNHLELEEAIKLVKESIFVEIATTEIKSYSKEEALKLLNERKKEFPQVAITTVVNSWNGIRRNTQTFQSPSKVFGYLKGLWFYTMVTMEFSDEKYRHRFGNTQAAINWFVRNFK